MRLSMGLGQKANHLKSPYSIAPIVAGAYLYDLALRFRNDGDLRHPGFRKNARVSRSRQRGTNCFDAVVIFTHYLNRFCIRRITKKRKHQTSEDRQKDYAASPQVRRHDKIHPYEKRIFESSPIVSAEEMMHIRSRLWFPLQAGR